MSKPHERAFALVLALLFLATSVGTGAAVIWQWQQDSKAERELEAAKKALTENANQDSKVKVEEGKLEGTKLANFTPVDKVETLQKTDLQAGTGAEVKPGATITFHYTGALAKDGTIFQSSHDMGDPVTYPLAQLIPGWQEGIPGMKVGGKRRLLIPAAQGYGDQAQSGIPANSDLVFDIEVTAAQ